MSGMSSNLDLSEFLNNDDSDGHRLAQFLIKKRGGVQRPDYLFLGSELQRLSLDIQLEKAPTKGQENHEQNNQRNTKHPLESEKDDVEEQIGRLTTAPVYSKQPTSPAKRASSPRLSKVLKSGGVSPGDCLRRFTLSKMGKRALLQEFEKTISDSDFVPNVCSTPMLQNAESSNSGKQQIETDTTKIHNENDSPIAMIVDSLMREEERHGNGLSPLKAKLRNSQNNSAEMLGLSSPVKKQSMSLNRTRTFSMEKGQTPGQIILTPNANVLGGYKQPNQSQNMQMRSRSSPLGVNIISPKRQIQTRHTTFTDEHDDDRNNTSQIRVRSGRWLRSSENEFKSPEHSTTNRSQITIVVESPKTGTFVHSPKRRIERNTLNNSSMLQETCINATSTSTRRSSMRQTKSDNIFIPNTQPINISIAMPPHDDIEIPETQEPVENLQNISIHPPTSNVDINHTHCNSVRISTNAVSASPNAGANRTLRNQNSEKGNNKSNQNNRLNSARDFEGVADNLKLSDIMTDDEEEGPETSDQSQNNNSEVPLNLVASTRKGRTKRLRKRSMSKRRLNMECSTILSTEAETEQPLNAHKNQFTNRKKITKKKSVIPLNKAPGTPLNGEKFASELARMSNYEILDLRKRNSMGKVFAISGRKSMWEKEEAKKKQTRLDENIEMELLRRKAHVGSNEIAEAETEIYPPVPNDFRDTLPLQGCDNPNEGDEHDSSLVDERSTDRISFMNHKQSFKRGRRSKKNMPEVLENYLLVPQKISEKNKNGKLEKSRRALYARGFSDSEEQTEEQTINKLSTTSLPFVPSPPKSDVEHMSRLTVVSPPPPQESFTSPELPPSKKNSIVIENATVPPPQDFDSDSGVESNKSHRTNSQSISHAANTDAEGVFKMPVHPAPKRKYRKKVEKTIASVISSEDQPDEETTSGTLRRSKRVHVPPKTPLFQILYRQVLEKNERLSERRKQLLREKSEMGESSTASGVKSGTSRKRSKPLTTVLESDVLEEASGNTDLPLKTKSKTKTKNKVGSSNEKRKQANDALECSRIVLSPPPPINHFNTVFDQLRNSFNGSTSKATFMSPFKIKKLRVRLPRIKIADRKAVDITESNTNLSARVTSASLPALSDSGRKESNEQLISWLMHLSENENSQCNDEIFQEMRVSCKSNLSFTELQGIEYAFYNTEDRASLGYLRFKPGQKKPRKRAKRFVLTFVTLSGNFRITANDKESIVGPGDMVAIEKCVYYDIENITDKIGILMVVKK